MKLPFPSSLTRCVSLPAAVVCPSCLQTTFPFSTLAQNLARPPHKLQPNQSRQRSSYLPDLFPGAFLLTPNTIEYA
jgi:hypothetical protein